MRTIRISEDFVPVNELKARTADWLRRVADTGQPLVVTQNGRPAGVLLSPATFDALTERAALVSAVEEGSPTPRPVVSMRTRRWRSA